MFTANEGTPDRIIRLVLGIVLLALTFTALSGIWQIVAGIVGAIMLFTGAVGFCPLYRVLGISTCAARPSARR